MEWIRELTFMSIYSPYILTYIQGEIDLFTWSLDRSSRLLWPHGTDHDPSDGQEVVKIWVSSTGWRSALVKDGFDKLTTGSTKETEKGHVKWKFDTSLIEKFR